MFCVLAAFASEAGAFRIVNARVDLMQERYKVDFVVILDGEAPSLKRIITDYKRFAELSPTVTHSRLISGQSGQNARIQVTFHPCILAIFCRDVIKVSDIHIDTAGVKVEYVMVPELSDFREGRETIMLEDESTGNVSRVRFEYFALLEPKFFVPPLLGPWLIRHRIIEDLKTTSRSVEHIMQREVAGDSPSG